MYIKASGITDVGLVRDGNEDSLSLDRSHHLYVVADGMGGHLAGEVASRVAVEMITKSFRKWMEDGAGESTLFCSPDASLSLQGNYVQSSIRLANRVIYEMASEHEQYRGMGTTIAALLVSPSRVIAANVGDSRLYLIRDEAIERLSRDHTLISEQIEMGLMTEEEAASSPLKHVLTRNLGSAEGVAPEVFEIAPAPNDRFVLCSDGLTDLVSDDEILETAMDQSDPEALCRNLVAKALGRGGHDNTTVISVFLTGMAGPADSTLKKIGFLVADLAIGFQKAVKKFVP